MLTEISLSFLSGMLAFNGTSHKISGYSVAQGNCRERETAKVYRVFRSFLIDRVPMELAVDVDTLETRLVDPQDLECDSSELQHAVEDSRYGRALMSATKPPYPLLDDGIQHAEAAVPGTFLTVDFCPTKRDGFASALFRSLRLLSEELRSPVPVAISVSGRWIRNHSAHFSSIVRLAEDRKIAITWVNHSDSHPYLKGQGPAKNFLLESGIDPNREILRVEIELLERGQLPSIFFRFPGLVSSRDWIERLVTYSLIPLGADAWLAVDQNPTAGSVILVHGNGNEPRGVSLLLRQWDRIRKLGPFQPLSNLFKESGV